MSLTPGQIGQISLPAGAGSNAAVVSDTAGNEFQAVVVTFPSTAGGDPDNIAGSASGFPVQLVGGGLAALVDEAAVAQGNAQGLLSLIYFNDAYTPIPSGSVGMIRGTKDGKSLCRFGARQRGL